jgi:hypothetical protein
MRAEVDNPPTGGSMTRTQESLGDPNHFALNGFGICAWTVDLGADFIVMHVRSAYLVADTLVELEQRFGAVSIETQRINGLWRRESGKTVPDRGIGYLRPDRAGPQRTVF